MLPAKARSSHSGFPGHAGPGDGRFWLGSQIETEGAEEGPFSDEGDSDSLVVTTCNGEAEYRAVGLVLPGSDRDGPDDQGRTCAQPIHEVLSALKAGPAPWSKPRADACLLRVRRFGGMIRVTWGRLHSHGPARHVMNAHTVDEVRGAKKRALDVFRALADVGGVGITRIDGVYGLKVNLLEEPKPSVKLPDEVDGVPVRVEVVGGIRAL